MQIQDYHLLYTLWMSRTSQVQCRKRIGQLAKRHIFFQMDQPWIEKYRPKLVTIIPSLSSH